MKPQLIFVYNADSGLFNSVTDFAHKIISPATYACNLCALTYGSFSMKNGWKTFVQQLPFEVFFLHKNEFEKAYNFPTALPVIFIKDKELEVLVSSKQINNCTTLQQLQDLINAQLVFYAQHHHSNL